MSHTYAVVITFITVWPPTMEWTIQDQSHTLNLTHHENKVLELMCEVPPLQGLRTVDKLEIGVQNSTTSPQVPLVTVTFDNEIFKNVSLDPLARVKAQMDSKDSSKCSLQVTQPLRFGVYWCSIYYDNGSPNVKSFQVKVDEHHKESNNDSFTVKVLTAIVVKATWVQPLTSELYEVSLTQFTFGEAEKPVGQTILYVNNTAKSSYESELVLLSSFSNRVHAGEENKFEVSLYLRSDTNSKDTNYSVSVSSYLEGLRRISGLKEITCEICERCEICETCEIQSDQVWIGLTVALCFITVLCLIFVVLYIHTRKSLKSPKTSSSLPQETQTDPMEFGISQSTSTHNLGSKQPKNPHVSSTSSTQNKPKDDRSGATETVELELKELGIKQSELDSGDEREELLGKLKVMGDPVGSNVGRKLHNTDMSDTDRPITLHKQNR